MADNEKHHSQEGTNMESANEKHEQTLSDTSSTAGSIHAVKGEKQETLEHDHAKSTDGARSPPDIDHEEAEAAVPGHELDVELGEVSPRRHHNPQHHQTRHEHH
jgi:hypothetical protein